MNLTYIGRESFHVAIIMDGNGRWATRRGRPRTFGHRAGATSVRKVVEVSPDLGIDTLTLYAFSADNWQRPVREVSALMRLCRHYIEKELDNCLRNNVSINVIGRRDRLDPSLVRAIEKAERATSSCHRLRLRIALDYSARDAIVAATNHLRQNGSQHSREDFIQALGESINCREPVTDVDLLIRTGAEQRLSDFLLWECAYAELHFVDKLWPDFGKSDLAAAVTEYQQRERRFGTVPSALPTSPALQKVRSG